MYPGRVDVIDSGGSIRRTLMRRVAAANSIDWVVTSEHDFLDGIAFALGSRG